MKIQIENLIVFDNSIYKIISIHRRLIKLLHLSNLILFLNRK